MTAPTQPQHQPATPVGKQTIEPGIGAPARDPQEAEGLATLQALRASDKILYARNVSDKPISCREKNGSINVDFMLECRELAIIPKEALYVRGFIKCWQRKEVKISDSMEMENEFLLDLDGRVSESQAMQAKAMEMLQENPQNNDIMQFQCLELHPGMPEGAPVFQRAKDTREGVPPLCDQHKHQAHRWVGTKQPSGQYTFQKM